MNGLQQTSMGTSPFAMGGANANFANSSLQGASGLNSGLNSVFDPSGFNGQMNGLLQQQAAMGSMVSQMMNVLMMVNQMLMLKQMQAMVSSAANFGGGNSGSGNGINSFLGGTNSVGGSSAPAATSSDFGSVPSWGAAMAKDAEKHAVSGPGGWCFKYVCEALARAGVKGGVGGASAYMAADQLAKNPKFREIKVAPADLPKLPAGAIVVWDRNGSGASSAGRIHGHISISLGDGREVSDVIRKQTTNMGSNVRVFLPK